MRNERMCHRVQAVMLNCIEGIFSAGRAAARCPNSWCNELPHLARVVQSSRAVWASICMCVCAFRLLPSPPSPAEVTGHLHTTLMYDRLDTVKRPRVVVPCLCGPSTRRPGFTDSVLGCRLMCDGDPGGVEVRVRWSRGCRPLFSRRAGVSGYRDDGLYRTVGCCSSVGRICRRCSW